MSFVIYKAATHPPCEHSNHTLCEPCNELTEIESQAHILHSQLKHLHHHHCQTLIRRNHIHSPIIHRFPLEIVSYIFTLAFPPIEPPCYTHDEAERASPLILTKVCHTWRVLALSTPRLWSNIAVDAREPNFSLLNHQIVHSGNVPLSIRLFASASYPKSCTEEAMSFVIKQLHRTASLCLHLSDQIISTLSGVSETDYQKAAPDLDELHIHRTDPVIGSHVRIKFSIDPPRPRRVILQSLNQDQLLIDWSNISSATLHDSDALFPLLTSANDLKQLILYDCHIPPAEHPLIVNHSIQELSLSTAESSHIMFTTTSLPSLRILSFHARVPELSMLAPLCSVFLRRSSCPLEELSVDILTWAVANTRNAMHALTDVLENTKKLQRLSIRLSGLDFPFASLEPLVRRFNSSGFLPCLKTLFLMTHFLPPVNLLLDVLSAGDDDEHSSLEIADGSDPSVRRPLNKLIFEFQSFLSGRIIPQDDLLRISRLQRAGKTISITSYADGTPSDVIENSKSYCWE